MHTQWILAQGATEPGASTVEAEPIGQDLQTTSTADGTQPGPTSDAPPPKPNPLQFLLPVVMVVLLIMMFRSPKKQQKKHQQMIQTLERNDRVRTIGGILGTVMDAKPDEIVLKVDESTNTKIRIAPSAIAKNLTKQPE